MKPKNLILIGVAVVCGLVAAFLTARMTAGSSGTKVELDMVEVPVAVNDIPIGTKLPQKELETYFAMKAFPREAVPPSALLSLDEIGDKRTMRTIRQGETVSADAVNAKGFIDPPDGTVLMTTPISLDQSASGFAVPGYKVMVIASKKSQKKKMDIVFPLFLDMLILAVDTNPSPPQAGGQKGQDGGQNGQNGGATTAGFQKVSMISFAVTPKQSVLLAMAAKSDASLRLGLPNQDEGKKQVVIDGYKQMVPTEEQILDIFADRWPDEDEQGSKQPKVEMVQALVPTEVLAAGTELTQRVLDKKFKTVEFPKEFVSEMTATAEEDLLDKFATADLVPSLMVPKPHLANEAPKKPEPQIIREVQPGEPMVLAATKVGPGDDAASPKADTDTTPSLPKPKEFVYVAITTPQGRRYQKFEVTEKGNKYVGDVSENEYQQQQSGE